MWNLVLSGQDDAPGIGALLEAGADVSRRDSEGYTVLHEACRGGMTGVAKVLLEHGADAEAVGGGGAARPLHLAAMGDHASTVELLLAAGVAVDRPDEGAAGATALMYAANTGALGSIDVLLRSGASVGASSRDGRSVLHYASFCADATVAEALVAAGASALPTAEVWARDKPPLHIMGEFARYTHVTPRVVHQPLGDAAGGLFSEHALLHFAGSSGDSGSDDSDAGAAGGEAAVGGGAAATGDGDGDGSGSLVVHRFRLKDDDQRAPSHRSAGSFDAALVAGAAALRLDEPTGALVSNQGGYHSASPLRGRADDGPDEAPCWDELHQVIDAAVAAGLAVKEEVDASEARARGGGAWGRRLEARSSWVNVNGAGDTNKLHTHEPAVYSGTYYAQLPRDVDVASPVEEAEAAPAAARDMSGAFVLRLSTAGEPGGGGGAVGDSESECRYSLVRPERGMLLLFPATMLHAVLPFWPEEGADVQERVSVGFNVG